MKEPCFSARISRWNLQKQFIVIKRKNSWFDMAGHFPFQVPNRVTYSCLLTPDSLETHLFLTFVLSKLLAFARFLTKVSRSERENQRRGSWRISHQSTLEILQRLRSILLGIEIKNVDSRYLFPTTCALLCNRPQSYHVLSGGKRDDA